MPYIGHRVTGLQDSSGEYQGRPYDNMKLHCEKHDEKTRGLAVETLVVKRSIYNATPAQVGDVIHPLYDRYGKIESLVAMAPWPEMKK